MVQFGQREFDKFFLFFNNLLDDDLVHGNPSRRNSTSIELVFKYLAFWPIGEVGAM